MKVLTLLLFAFLALPLSSLAQTGIEYSYDSAGNRTGRTYSLEVASVYDSPNVEDFNISDLDFKQTFACKNSMLLGVLELDSSEEQETILFEQDYLRTLAQNISLPSKSSGNFVWWIDMMWGLI